MLKGVVNPDTVLPATQQVAAMPEIKRKPKRQEDKLNPVKVMPTELIQHYASKFKLTWRQVYQLDAEFQSLVKIECQELQIKLDKL